MKNFLKHVLTVVLFVCGLILLLIPVSMLVNPKDNTVDAGMRDISANGILAEPEQLIDVLIIGDSESYSSFVPLQIYDEYGYTVYICGSPGQQMTYSAEFLYKTFERHSPKLVILETDCIFHYFSLADVMHIYGDKYFPVFQYHNRWKSLTARDFDFTVNYTHPDNTKGYWYSTEINEADNPGYMQEVKDSPNITTRNKQFVQLIKQYCEDRGAQLMLISAPSTVNMNMERHQYLTELADELGLVYVDTNTLQDEIPIDWTTDTSDAGDHINYYGARKVTTYLGKYLADTGLLSDHRGDPEYVSWDEALAAFLERVAE